MAITTEQASTLPYNDKVLGEERRGSLERNSPVLQNGFRADGSSIGSEDFTITRSFASSSSCRSTPSSPRSSASAPCSRESVSSALDDYISASTEGREAFTLGDLHTAVKHFDHALDIELQTELECLYDTSIGFMSGLVRSEVNARLHQQNSMEYSVKCERILKHLSGNFSKALQGMSKKHSNPKWFLQMGAALVVVNEWEKAKLVYTEGMNCCKDRKALKLALKNLIKIEQMTSYGDIPVEDQPETASPRLSPHTSPFPSPAASPQHSPCSSPRRDRSKSVAFRERRLRRDRILSLSLDRNELTGRQRKSSAVTISVTPTASMKPPSNKRSSLFFSSRRQSLISPDTSAAWSSCFDPASCRGLGQTEFQPSAITHMRSLSALNYDDLYDGAQDETLTGHGDHNRFNAVKLTCLKIEDDDSELDDSD